MEELDRAAICRRIAEAREKAGLTQEELADAVAPSVHWRTVQIWERGERNKKGEHRWTVPWKRLGQIAELTGSTKEWLIHGDQLAADDPALAGRVERIEQLLEVLVARLAPGEELGPAAEEDE